MGVPRPEAGQKPSPGREPLICGGFKWLYFRGSLTPVTTASVHGNTCQVTPSSLAMSAAVGPGTEPRCRGVACAHSLDISIVYRCQLSCSHL